MDGAIAVLVLGFIYFANGQRVSILPNEKNVIKFQNESYFVSCQSSDNQAPQWTDPRNTKVQASVHSRIRIEHGMGLELYLNNIQFEDAGIYTCNTASARAGFNLTVIRPITFNPREAIQTASEGENYRMKCTAQGHSQRPKIFWKVDQKMPQAPKYRVLNDGSLQILSVTQHDANRHYVCRAMDMNPAKPDSKEMRVQLKVRIRPRPKGSDRVENWGVIGEWTNLTCSVYAEPPVHFDWFYEGRRLGTGDEFIITTPEINVSILQVLVKNERKLGLYMCSARNDMGTYNRTLQLKKGRKPPAVQLDVEHLGSVGVAVRTRFKSDPERYRDPAAEEDRRTGADLPIVGYDALYKMVTKSDWVRGDVQKTSYGFILRGLLPNVTYLIRAAPRNSASRGEFSKELRITTPKNVPFTPAFALPTCAFTSHSLITLSPIILGLANNYLII